MDRNFKNRWKYIYTLIILAIFVTGFVLCYSGYRYHADPLLTFDTAEDISDGWYIKEDQKKKSVRFPSEISVQEDTLTVYRMFSAEEIEKGILLITNNRQNIQISSDGAEIYSLGLSDDSLPTSVNEYSVVHLNQIDTGEDTEIAVTFSKCRNHTCILGEAVSCTPSEAFVRILFKDTAVCVLLVFILGLSIAMLVIVVVLLYKKMKNPRIFCLLFFLVTMGLWTVSGMWLATLVPISDQLICHINYTATMLIPVPIAFFAFYSPDHYRSRSLTYIIIVSILNIIIQQILYLCGIGSFYDMLPVTHLVMVAVAAVSVYAQVRDFQSFPSSQAILRIITFAIPLAAMMATLILFWTNDSGVYGQTFIIGMVFFIGMLLYNAIHSILENMFYRRKTETELELFQKMSVCDVMTGLGNRRAFNDAIEAAYKKELEDAVLFFLDVNGLKTVNDTYGHKEGDVMLVSAAQCIFGAFENYGKSFRIGGDEFAVIVENPEFSDEEYIERLDRQITQSNYGRIWTLSIARGSEHLFDSDGLKRSVSLWKSNADRKMYADKMRTKMLMDDSEQSGIVGDDIDTLTGILTIDGFRKNAVHILYQNPDEQYALWYYDIKKFKFVNDFFGYEMGDRLIRYLSKVILETIHEGETCGRVAGSNIISLVKVQEDTSPEEHFNYMANSIRKFFTDYDISYQPEMSAGIYFLQPEDMKSPNINQILDWANVAQKSVKHLSGYHYCVFGEEMWKHQWREQLINQSLNEALKKGEISVWIQPQYNYATGEMEGAEALSRWKHGTLGWISPTEFIPALERTGQISKLDYYIWEEVCRLMKKWRMSSTMFPVSVSVNISRLDVKEGDIIHKLNALLNKYGLSPSALRLEITESAYMERPDMLLNVVNQLHRHGFTVEMDDFGSGYSSLNMLKDVPVDIIKLDICFLQGENYREKGSKIVASIVRMANEIGIPVLTEGVENEEQARYLSSVGCDLMQGYFFSKPLPVAQFEDLLREELKKRKSTREKEQKETDKQ